MTFFVRLIPPLILVGLVLNLVRLGLIRDLLEPASIVPYKIVINETNVTRTGQREPGAVFTRALRSDGSHVKRSELLGRLVPVSQRDISLVDGTRISLNEIKELKSTTFDPARSVFAEQRDPSARCLKTYGGATVSPHEEIVGELFHVGHRVVHVRRNDTTNYLALDLGCAVLRTTVGPDASPWNIQTATTIDVGEPPSALFAVPDNYREVAPSELFDLPAGVRAATVDEYYHSHRPAQ
jgi:hypothetical protein